MWIGCVALLLVVIWFAYDELFNIFDPMSNLNGFKDPLIDSDHKAEQK